MKSPAINLHQIPKHLAISIVLKNVTDVFKKSSIALQIMLSEEGTFIQKLKGTPMNSVFKDGKHIGELENHHHLTIQA